MKLAFCLFKYFPYGGLQRDFLRIARECHARGHEIHVFTMKWEGDPEPNFHIHLLKPRGFTNHHRGRTFANQLNAQMKKNDFDLVIGFNKLPNLDVYYAADVCYQARMKEERSVIYRLLPRYREWTALENDVFAQGHKPEIFLISPFQQHEYESFYQTESARFHLLPPGISRDRIAPANAGEIRQQVREHHHLREDDLLLLMVGSSFKTKGVDRSIEALASLPVNLREHCYLFVIGVDKKEPFEALANKLNVKDRVKFLGGRPDVPHYLLAADLLLHPSHHENTGTVILEAIAAGLPVLTIDVCGYAHYVTEAKAGHVLTSPFDQKTFNLVLEKMVTSGDRTAWHQNALSFAKDADIYSMPMKAVDLIESIGRERALSKI